MRLGAAEIGCCAGGYCKRDMGRSERLLCEQLGYHVLYRWFVGLGMEDAACAHGGYMHNRDQLIEHDVIKALFTQGIKQAKAAQLLSSDSFSVDSSLIGDWASHKPNSSWR